MSDNIYNILNNFNKVAQEPQKPATQTQPKAKSQLQESMDQVLSEKYMGFKKTVAAVKKGGSAENPEAVAAAIGRKKYGKEKFQKAAAAGKKLGEAAKPDYIDLDKDGNKTEPMKKAAKDAKSKKVQEVAPPGAKAERMVKHIKKGYAKDGKLTKTEKSKAYGAAWKAHNKGKVEEAIKAMFEAGFTKEQIVEGWDDMMKAVANRSNDMKPGEKRQGAKGEIEKTSSGIKHTRRYDRKTGETETGSDGQQVKRSRGRPKKSTFESFTTAKKMITEHFRELIEGSIQGGVWTSNPPKKGQPNVPVPQNIDGGSVSPDPKNSPTRPTPTRSTPTPNPTSSTPPTMGSIKGGVWTADAPKAGQRPVPVPQGLDEVDAEMEGMRKLAGLKDSQKELDSAEVDEQLTMPPTDPKETGAVMGTTMTSPEAQALIKSPQGQQLIKAMTDPKNAVPAVTATIKPDKEATAMMQNTNEDDMEEGNEFSGALDNARDEGEKTFKVNGKTYPVKEGEELLQMLRIAGIKVLEDTQIDECGMSSMGNGMMGQHEQEGRMNVSTNMSSDGNKSVTITADGNSALELMQMLKLAGMGGHDQEHDLGEPEGVMVVATDSNAEEVEEEKDERYHASTTPDEHVMPVQAQTKGGDGDVAGKEKKMTPNGYQFGDNPRAMKESMSLKLMKEYETIKVKK